jgi:hypothetical protein
MKTILSVGVSGADIWNFGGECILSTIGNGLLLFRVASSMMVLFPEARGEAPAWVASTTVDAVSKQECVADLFLVRSHHQ